jgi:prenyltransferase beta subunit
VVSALSFDLTHVPVTVVVALAAAALFPAGVARAGTGPNVSREVSYLVNTQNTNGGFGATSGQASSELYSAWVAMGLAASGRNPATITRDGKSVLDSLRSEASTLAGTGDIERTILALSACGASAYSFNGHDLLSELLRARSSDGSFENQVNRTAFAILALRSVGHSAGYSIISSAARWIEHQQNSDGGFSFASRGGASDVDDTAAALQSLVDADARDAQLLSRILNFLVHAQNPDGGYPQESGGESNAQSTAWAVQGLIAAGHDPESVRRGDGRSPIGYLQSLITSNGSVRYSRTSAQNPVWVTSQALTALAGKTFPIASPR